MYDKKKLQSWYYNKRTKMNKGVIKITYNSFSDFYEWFKQENKKGCHYCGLSETEQISLIEKELIESKRFFGNGGTRGNRLEVDRKNPKGEYSRENSVLCCYFCNNDKSDVFSESQYIEFINQGKSRVKFLRKLLKGKSK